MNDALDRWERRLAKAELAHNVALKTVKQERSKLKQAKRTVEAVAEAQAIAQSVAQLVQQTAHKRISAVVTKCLQLIFEEEAYEFQIKFEKKRSKTEAVLLFLKNSKEFKPLISSEGGVVDLAAFALRISCILLTRPKSRKLIVADEPFRFINGSSYQDRVGGMLEMLAREMDVQFIIVTDDDWLKGIGKTIEV